MRARDRNAPYRISVKPQGTCQICQWKQPTLHYMWSNCVHRAGSFGDCCILECVLFVMCISVLGISFAFFEGFTLFSWTVLCKWSADFSCLSWHSVISLRVYRSLLDRSRCQLSFRLWYWNYLGSVVEVLGSNCVLFREKMSLFGPLYKVLS